MLCVGLSRDRGFTPQIKKHIVTTPFQTFFNNKESYLFFPFQLRPTAKKLEYKAIDLALSGHPYFDMINVFTMDS
jgi:hypothetical protein